MGNRARDLAAYFYEPAPAPASKAASPTTTPSREDLIRAIRTLMGQPGVTVFETLEHVDESQRRRLAGLVQAETRQLKRSPLAPVLPRSSKRVI